MNKNRLELSRQPNTLHQYWQVYYFYHLVLSFYSLFDEACNILSLLVIFEEFLLIFNFHPWTKHFPCFGCSKWFHLTKCTLFRNLPHLWSLHFAHLYLSFSGWWWLRGGNGGRRFYKNSNWTISLLKILPYFAFFFCIFFWGSFL